MVIAILYGDPTLGAVHNREAFLEVLQRIADPEEELHTARDENERAVFDFLIYPSRQKRR